MSIATEINAGGLSNQMSIIDKATNSDGPINVVIMAKTLLAWNTDSFRQKLKEELESLPISILPLDNALESLGKVMEGSVSIMFLNAQEMGEKIQTKVAAIFTEIVPAYCCPMEPNENRIYCEILVEINKKSAEASFQLISE